MKRISPLHNKKTSVSLPRKSHRRLRAAQRIFERNGIHFSEQEIYRRLLKLFLRNWRGRGKKTDGLRRYNMAGRDYEIHAIYINQVLYAALWERALHSGESISRMLDMAIRVYLPRLLEFFLQESRFKSERSVLNCGYWAARLRNRPRQYPDFFINYACKTVCNDSLRLEYFQGMQIIPKTGLSPWDILELMRIAA